MIHIIKTEDYEQMSRKAFEVILETIRRKPDCTLGLATGSSPLGIYSMMVNDHKVSGTSYSKVRTFNLDEYAGIDVGHPESYHSFMHRNLFDHIDIMKENIHIPDGQDDLQKNCDMYNMLLAENTIDLQLLGIGSNGHIGFNEPGSPFDSVTHVVDLQESTICDNARFFDNDVSKVPRQAVTMGISNVMAARKILLVASGKNKAEAVRAMIMGKITEEIPASVLQRHPDVVVVIDREAAGLLYR